MAWSPTAYLISLMMSQPPLATGLSAIIDIGARLPGRDIGHSSTTTFKAYVDGHKQGPGVWKWSHYLDAYDEIFGSFKGRRVKLCEVGVQSGGSLQMWQSGLGVGLHLYGVDINPQVQKFQNDKITISVGDQGDAYFWDRFFSDHAQDGLDILIDDASHLADKMLVTFQKAWPKIRPGGFIGMEDIHGVDYQYSFLDPVSSYLSGAGEVESVHLYPYLLLVKKQGGHQQTWPYLIQGRIKASNFTHLLDLVDTQKTSQVVLENPAPETPYTSEQSLNWFFWQFRGLFDFSARDVPSGCAKESGGNCWYVVQNSHQQDLIKAVHIFPHFLMVDLPSSPPHIEAVRRGSEWLAY